MLQVDLKAIFHHTFMSTIAEELRGFEVEFNVPIFSATQTTRTVMCQLIRPEDTSESFVFLQLLTLCLL